MNPTRPRPDHSPLATRVLDAFLDGGGVTPRLPAGGRAEVSTAVQRLLVVARDRDAYAQVMNRLHRTRGAGDRVLACELAAELPGEQVYTLGVDALTDTELALVALSPAVLETVAEGLSELADEGQLKDVWAEVLGVAADEYLSTGPAAGGPPGPPAAATTASSVGRPARPGGRRYRGSVLVGASVASLMAGVAIAAVIATGGRPKTGYEVAAVAATARDVVPRGGAAEEVEIEFTSPRRGFVTVIVPRPAGTPLVYPEPSADLMSVPAGGRATVGPYDKRVRDRVVVLVTQTPAAETVGKALDRLPPGGETDQALMLSRVTDFLSAAGFEWTVVATAGR